ncbi:hypothetical protein STEG23_003922 [Scotinomys teguina]
MFRNARVIVSHEAMALNLVGWKNLDAEQAPQEFGQPSLDSHQDSAFQTEMECRVGRRHECHRLLPNFLVRICEHCLQVSHLVVKPSGDTELLLEQQMPLLVWYLQMSVM